MTNKSLAIIVLAIFLIAYAIVYFIGFREGGLVLAILAGAAGILLLLGK